MDTTEKTAEAADYCPAELRPIRFHVNWVEMKDLGWWRLAPSPPSFGALTETLAHLPVLQIEPDHAAGWEPGSAALGLFIAEFLRRIQSRRYTIILQAEGNMSIGAGDLVPLFPYIFHGGKKSRFYVAETLCTDSDAILSRFSTARVSFEYDPTQLERMMRDFHGNAFRLDTSFDGALWPNKNVEGGLRFEHGSHDSYVTLMAESPLWFRTNRDFDSFTLFVPFAAWKRRLNVAVRATLETMGTTAI